MKFVDILEEIFKELKLLDLAASAATTTCGLEAEHVGASFERLDHFGESVSCASVVHTILGVEDDRATSHRRCAF